MKMRILLRPSTRAYRKLVLSALRAFHESSKRNIATIFRVMPVYVIINVGIDYVIGHIPTLSF
jgi:hypothetical protein